MPSSAPPNTHANTTTLMVMGASKMDSPSVKYNSKCSAMISWSWSRRNRRNTESTRAAGILPAAIQSDSVARSILTKARAKEFSSEQPKVIRFPAWPTSSLGIPITLAGLAKYPVRERPDPRFLAGRARASVVLVSCESGHSSHLWISPVRGLALACRPSDSRISCNSDCLLVSGISSAL